MNKLKLTVLSALVASVVSPAVMAHQQGDIIVVLVLQWFNQMMIVARLQLMR